MSNQDVKNRILKDIDIFNKNISELIKVENKEELKIVSLSKMYAQDSKSYLDKDDLYTSFSCISYAHGLLDAIRTINGVGDYV